MKQRRRLRMCVALACGLAMAACSSGSRDAGVPTNSSTPGSKPEVLVAIGSGATFGDGLADGDGLENPLRDSWPQKLYHEAFPQSTVLINAADQLVTVGRALRQPLSIALEQDATVVAVWLGDADLQAGVDVATFEAELNELVQRLTAAGARVLLGNLSRAEPGAAAYDDAITRVSNGPSAAGVTLVDVAAALADTPEIGPSDDVDIAMSEKIAEAFGAAVPRS